jgi:molybdopterin biosynthesis enzyme
MSRLPPYEFSRGLAVVTGAQIPQLAEAVVAQRAPTALLRSPGGHMVRPT